MDRMDARTRQFILMAQQLGLFQRARDEDDDSDDDDDSDEDDYSYDDSSEDGGYYYDSDDSDDPYGNGGICACCHHHHYDDDDSSSDSESYGNYRSTSTLSDPRRELYGTYSFHYSLGHEGFFYHPKEDYLAEDEGDLKIVADDHMAMFKAQLGTEVCSAYQGAMGVVDTFERSKTQNMPQVNLSASRARLLKEANAPDATLDSVAMTTDALSKLKLPDLKKLCRRLGCTIGGKKEAVVDRIIKQAEVNAKAPKKADLVVEQHTASKLHQMTVTQLRRVMEKYGIDFTAKTVKREMIQMIERCDLTALDHRVSAAQMDDYFRGQVQYTLPPSVVLQIFHNAFVGSLQSDATSPKTWMRWKLSLGLINKWAFKNVSQWFTSVSLTKLRTWNAYQKNPEEVVLYRHFINPFCLLKNITKLSIYDYDLEVMSLIRGTKPTLTPAMTSMFGNLESFTVSHSVFHKCSNHLTVPPFPKLRSVTIHESTYVSIETTSVDTVTKIDARYLHTGLVATNMQSMYSQSIHGNPDTLESLSKLTTLRRVEQSSRQLSNSTSGGIKKDQEQIEKDIAKEINDKVAIIVQLLKDIDTQTASQKQTRAHNTVIMRESLDQIPFLLHTWRRAYILFSINDKIPNSYHYDLRNSGSTSIFTEWMAENYTLEHLALDNYDPAIVKAIENCSTLHTLELCEGNADPENIFRQLASEAPPIKTLIFYVSDTTNIEKVSQLATKMISFKVDSHRYYANNGHFDGPTYKLVLKRVSPTTSTVV
ncbi:hypothetical protein DFA_03307 [Cavenderia fasciculata]|uniref:SAP domain-containing protein n=1 Tax=Cavenderia fasciculata TaxID=261658 RepID=F4PH77_CACFS|nr:uncharacterized protein DFA_03307 [Cavenderia fasciculata]EGG25061.1 hypothetical protein DFA_03307 [Cavenderia fasciculata]|eukprot:XP_004362912.1 hypothetical protein DFA_03307 [Cavenderia fasciculata]